MAGEAAAANAAAAARAATKVGAGAAKGARSWLVNGDGSATATNIALQVVAGMAISLIVYWVSLLVMRTDKLVIDSKLGSSSPREVPVVAGYIDCASYTNRVFNTVNEASPSFLALPRSVNRKGGAQFTYSMWLFLGDVSDANVRNKVLFSRGSMQKFRYARAAAGKPVSAAAASDLVIRCPLVRFGSNYRELVIEFNTADDPDQRVVITNRQDAGDSALRRNAASLSANYWVMLTFVFEDNVPINDFESGVVVKYYINDTLYQVSRVRSALRQNNGSLHVLPLAPGETAIQRARMSNLSYFNHALGDEDVRARYLRGPSKTPHSDPRNRFGVPLYMSAANQADLTNM